MVRIARRSPLARRAAQTLRASKQRRPAGSSGRPRSGGPILPQGRRRSSVTMARASLPPRSSPCSKLGSVVTVAGSRDTPSGCRPIPGNGLAFDRCVAYRSDGLVWCGGKMLFAKKDRKLRRVLVVEDEPLVAFDNEHALVDADYEVVGTVDNVEAALELIEEGAPDIVLCDLKIAGEGTGMDVARAAQVKGIK